MKKILHNKKPYYMDIQEIIVHPKTFHTDEVVGIAVLRVLFPGLRNVPIKRALPSKQDLRDPRVIVIDTGEKYEPAFNNFDHHQDRALPCSSTSLWRHFCPEATFEERQIKKVLDVLFFRSIDRHDRGIAFAGGSSIVGAISSMNFLPGGFDLALSYAELTLRALIAKQKEVLPVRNFWHTGVSFGGSRLLRVFPGYLSVSIREKVLRYAESKKKALFLLWPVSDEGDYHMLHVVHGSQTLPVDKRQIDFDGTSAVYVSKKDAIDHALELAAKKFDKDRYWFKVDNEKRFKVA